MRKAISITVNIWIESEEEPSENYGKKAIQAVRDVIEAGKSSHPEMKFRITKVKETGDGFKDD